MQRPSIIEYIGEKASQQTAREDILEILALRKPSSRPLMPLKTCNALDSYIALQCLLTRLYTSFGSKPELIT